jgi:hypothetical protein
MECVQVTSGLLGSIDAEGCIRYVPAVRTVGMTERKRTMDYMGILKEAWGVTRRNKSLWILGLFAGGSAGLSTSNWNSNSSSSSGSKGLPPGWENIHSPNEALQLGLDQAGKQLGVSLGTAAQWWVILGIAVFALIMLCIGLWVIGLAARGGLIQQTREAIYGRPASAGAGWRSGMHYWGRVFAVGFLLALPLMALGLMALIVLAIFGIPALASGGGGGAFVAALVGMGLALSLIGLVAFVVGVVVSMLEEVALRHAVLDGRGAVDSIKATWDDLWKKRGLASMWLVMILVNICAGLAGAILFIPVVLLMGVVVGGAVLAGGLAMLWLLVPVFFVLMVLGMLFKAVYATFRNTAWTGFYVRIERPELNAA